MEDEKFGSIFVDGKLVNLDEIPLEDLKKLIKKVEEKEKKLKAEIASDIEHLDDDDELEI